MGFTIVREVKLSESFTWYVRHIVIFLQVPLYVPCIYLKPVEEGRGWKGECSSRQCYKGETLNNHGHTLISQGRKKVKDLIVSVPYCPPDLSVPAAWLAPYCLQNLSIPVCQLVWSGISSQLFAMVVLAEIAS